MEYQTMSTEEYALQRCIKFGRRNAKLREQNGQLRFSRLNYMVLSLLGWGLFVASAAGWLPK
jgi:hypothetical protein